jgi:hypothetical protein
MRVYVGLIRLAAYIFVIPDNHKWSIIVHAIKLDWLAACIALGVVGAALVVFLSC